MARGLDQLDQENGKTPPRRNPSRRTITKEEEAEVRMEQEFKKIDIDGWTKTDIEMTRDRLFEYFLGEIDTEAQVQLRKEVMAEKQTKAESLIQARLDHLASQGLEDLGEEWRHRVESYLGLSRDEYKVSISPVTDDYLKEQGQGFSFTVTYSEEAALLRLYRDQGMWGPVPPRFHPETLDKGEAEEKIGDLIQDEFTNSMRDEAVLVKDLASSEEEARAKAEAVIIEKMSSRLQDAKKYHEDILEAQARRRQQKEYLRRAEREEKEAQKAFQVKKQEVESVFSGLTWSDPKTTADLYIDDHIEYLVKKKARDFKREKIGHCDLVTYYEDVLLGARDLLQRGDRAHSVGGAIFYQGELRAFIQEDIYGVIRVVPCEVTESGFRDNDYVTRAKRATLLEPWGWQQRRRHKRKKDPQKNRAQAEEAARKYIDELIRQEALGDAS